jgi:hypothetical protein
MVPVPPPPRVRPLSPGSFVVELVELRVVVSLDGRGSAFVVVDRRTGVPLASGVAAEA